jgi:hypothetical protein
MKYRTNGTNKTRGLPKRYIRTIEPSLCPVYIFLNKKGDIVLRKFLVSLVIIIAALTKTCCAVNFSIDGVPMSFSNGIVIQSGISYMPVREFFEQKGFNVEWNDTTESINVFFKKFPLYDETLEVRNGKVQKNFNYEFLGDKNFSYESLSEKMVDCTNNQKYARVCNAEMAAELGSVYLKTTIKNITDIYGVDSLKLIVQYSSDLNAWCVSYAPTDENTHSHRDSSSVIISADDGRILKVYSGF